MIQIQHLLMRVVVKLVAFLFFYINFAFAQDHKALDHQYWKQYYAYNHISDIVSNDYSLWLASDYNILYYSIVDSQTKTFTSKEGLSGELISAIYTTPKDELFIGQQDGTLLYIENTDTDKVQRFTAINQTQTVSSSQKYISGFYQQGNLLYIMTNYGLTVFDTERLVFEDSYFLGQVNSMLATESFLYVATTRGLYRIDKQEPLKLDISKWELVDTRVYNLLYLDQDNFLAVSQKELLELTNYDHQDLLVVGIDLRYTAINNIISIEALQEDKFLLSTANNLITLQPNFQVEKQTNVLDRISDIALSRGVIYLATETKGVLTRDLDTHAIIESQIIPNAPLSNEPFRLSIHQHQLWVTYGGYQQGNFIPKRPDIDGISVLSIGNNSWENYRSNQLGDTSYLTNVVSDPFDENKQYITSYQQGLILLEDQLFVDRFDSQDGFESVSSLFEATRLNSAVFDSQGNLWVTNAFMNLAIKKFNTTSQKVNLEESVDFSQSIQDATQNLGYTDLLINDKDQLFMGTYQDGVLAYDINTKRHFQIPNQDITASQVNALSLDQYQNLWIGTSQGLRIAYAVYTGFDYNIDVQPVLFEDQQQNKTVALLENQHITDIQLDGANNQWIATIGLGVFYIDGITHQVIYHFTDQNSLLTDNQVNAITIDQSTGVVYFATSKGLCSFYNSVTTSSDDLKAVKVYPNPLRPQYESTVTISGMSDRTNVRITTVSGSLVYNAITQGGSLQWDTLDQNGKKVPTGVYLIFLYNQLNQEQQLRKLLIVR